MKSPGLCGQPCAARCPRCRARRDAISDVLERIEAIRLYIVGLDEPLSSASTLRRLAFHRGRLAALKHLWESMPGWLRWALRGLFARQLDETESGVGTAMDLQNTMPWCPLHDVPRAAFDPRCKCRGGER